MAGTALLAIDLFGQGECSGDGKPIRGNRLNTNGEKQSAAYAGFTYGYNYPLFAQRVHDILAAVGYARHGLGSGEGPCGRAGRSRALGRRGPRQAGAAIDRAAVDTAGFRFANLSSIEDADFLPGAAEYLDLPGMLALSAPLPLWLAGEGEQAPPVLDAAYRAAGHPDRLTLFSGGKKDLEAAVIKWLLP